MAKLYTHIQCIGFKIDTFPLKQHQYLGPAILDPNDPMKWMGWTVWKEDAHYLGLQSHQQDIDARVALMQQAIERAANAPNVKLNNQQSTLKLFMSPEFFFRGYTGAYPDMELIHRARTALEDVVSDSKFANWLFVFGSVLAAADLGNGSKEVYNIVYVIPGGGGGETRVVMKELKSGIDFLKSQQYLNPQGKYINLPMSFPDKVVHEKAQHLPAARPSGQGLERQKGAHGADSGGGIFDYENVTFGVEICLDHAAARLKQSPPSPGDWKVQVQLIPSAGMRIKPESVVATRSGFAFNVDGGGPHAKLSKVESAHRSNADATLSEVARAEEHNLTNLPPNFAQLYKPQTPSVVVFPKVALPHRVKA